ncbi:hypothetical protein ES703_30622 [subsurface metagenome]
MNQGQPITSLIPLGPQGQLLDPANFLIYLLTLPIRIITVVHQQLSQSRAMVPRAPFPDLLPSVVVEPVSYTVYPDSSPSPAPATYENEEKVDIVWNEEGLPTEIIIHRRATRA